MTDIHIDVLINGCGIGGAMLAYLLGRQGHRVVVVEQARRCLLYTSDAAEICRV